MNETSSLSTQTAEDAQRVPPTNERKYDMKFDGREWRLRWLMDTADLSSISHRNFLMICKLLRGSVFTRIVDGRQFLIDRLAKAIDEHEFFREAIADKQFVDLPFDSAKDFLRKLESERALLEALADAAVKLDATGGMALVMHVEHACNAAGDDFEGSCNKAYRSIQSLRHLYAIKNPSRGPLRRGG